MGVCINALASAGHKKAIFSPSLWNLQTPRTAVTPYCALSSDFCACGAGWKCRTLTWVKLSRVWPCSLHRIPGCVDQGPLGIRTQAGAGKQCLSAQCQSPVWYYPALSEPGLTMRWLDDLGQVPAPPWAWLSVFIKCRWSAHAAGHFMVRAGMNEACSVQRGSTSAPWIPLSRRRGGREHRFPAGGLRAGAQRLAEEGLRTTVSQEQ